MDEFGFFKVDLDHFQNFARKLNNFRKRGLYSDLRIKINDGSIFPVHKVLLTANCPYFERMFNSGMKECYQDIIGISTDVPGPIFEELLEYLYTSAISIKWSNVRELHENSVFLELDNLKELTEKTLSSMLVTERCLDIWRYAVKFSIESVLEECLFLISKSTMNFFDMFLNDLEGEELDTILSDSINLSCSQQNLYIQIMKWLKYDYEYRKIFLTQLLNRIHFHLIPNAFKSSVILNDELLNCDANFMKIVLNDFQKHLILMDSVVVKKPTIFLITRSKVIKLDKNNDFLVPIKKHVFDENAAYCTFGTDSFLTCGGYNTDRCEFYSNETKAIKYFPVMSSKRWSHRVIELNNMVYAIAGLGPGSDQLDVLDLYSDKWLQLPRNRNLQKCMDFGLCTYEQSIYIVGGIDRFSLNNVVQRYDPRESGYWLTLPTESNSSNLGLTKVVCIDNRMYTFNQYGCHLFDLKTNRWNKEETFQYGDEEWWRKFNLIHFNNLIYAFGYKGRGHIQPITCAFDYGTKKLQNFILDDFPCANLCDSAVLND